MFDFKRIGDMDVSSIYKFGQKRDGVDLLRFSRIEIIVWKPPIYPPLVGSYKIQVPPESNSIVREVRGAIKF